MSRTRRTMRAAAVMAASAWTVFAAGAIGLPAAQAVPIGPSCPALYVLAVQGTGQSSPSASPTADVNLLGALLGPVQAAVPTLVQRSYIGYPAGFGGAVPGGGTAPYITSVTDAIRQLQDALQQITRTCPATMVGGVGFSQGAEAFSTVAQEIGAGHGPIAANRVAAIELYADPDRPDGSPAFPGRPGQSRPDPAPGTSGAAVSGVQIASPTLAGSGIASNGQSFGTLTGRVAEICALGDLACAAPDRAGLLRFAARLAAQADLRNPIAALGSLNALLGTAFGSAWTTILDNDVRLGPGTVEYAPQKTLSQRLIDAADPRIPAPLPGQAGEAAARWAQITNTVIGNPLGVLPSLVGQLAGAVGQLAADNADLANPLVWAGYANTVAAHTGYAVTGQLAPGIAWLIASAHDIAGRHP
ncbi:hypothetical protein ABIA39_007556 [Nocardia sp. GAS34]|uniref:cutinase family protein n=1 Tax=unclassified Nocardia TaxID=2637762 RepID=UPI003D1D117B